MHHGSRCTIHSSAAPSSAATTSGAPLHHGGVSPRSARPSGWTSWCPSGAATGGGGGAGGGDPDNGEPEGGGLDTGGLDNERVVLVLRIARDGSVVGSWGEMAPQWREAAREGAASTVAPGPAGAGAGIARPPTLRATLALTLGRARPAFDGVLPDRLGAGDSPNRSPSAAGRRSDRRGHIREAVDWEEMDWEERVESRDGAELILTSHALMAGGALLTVTERLAPERLDSATIRTVLDLLPATVSIKDSRRRYVFVNRAWEAYADVPRESVLGKPHEDVISPEIDPRSRGRHTRDIADRDGHVLATGQALLAQEEHYVTANGVERTLLSNKLPLFDHTGAVNGVLSITMDVSDMVEAQTLLERARREAEAASRGKTEFLATISHELRTPLNGIVGLVGLLELTEPTQGQRALIAKLGDSAGILSTIIEKILEFAQAETRPPPPRREFVTVEELIDCAVAPLVGDAGAKGLSMNVDVAPSARITVSVDRTGVHRVLSELIGNAITFTAEGSITIRVTIDRRNPDETVLQVDVIDTGIGIRTDDVAKLFTPLFQADRSSTRRHGGIGMGLAVCRRAVEAMGGTLRMVPPDQREDGREEGQGSIFRMRVGVETVDDHPRPPPGHPARNDSPGSAVPDAAGAIVTDVNDGEEGLTLLSGRGSAAIADLLHRLGVSRTDPAPEIGGDPAQTLALVARHAAKGRRTRLLIVHGADMTVGDGPLYDRISVLFGTPRIPIIAIGVPPTELPDAVCLPFDVDGRTLVSAVAAILHDDRDGGGGFPDGAPSSDRPVDDGDGATTTPSVDSPAVIDPPLRTKTREEDAMQTNRATRILLAEDNEVNQLVAVGMLNSLGFEVDVVVNGEEAVAALDRNSYAAILMDIRMPVMDGLEATRRIRAMGGDRAAIPIIAVTANAMRGDQESCLAAGMNDYMAKPIRLATLQTTLRRWLPPNR